jgi:hypothetical protein
MQHARHAEFGEFDPTGGTVIVVPTLAPAAVAPVVQRKTSEVAGVVDPPPSGIFIFGVVFGGNDAATSFGKRTRL